MSHDVRYRYLNDAVFRAAVEMNRSLIRHAKLTPSELREAATWACTMEEERRPASPIYLDDLPPGIYETKLTAAQTDAATVVVEPGQRECTCPAPPAYRDPACPFHTKEGM